MSENQKLKPFDEAKALAGEPIIFYYREGELSEAKIVYKSTINDEQKYLVVFKIECKFPYEQCYWLRESEMFMVPKKKTYYYARKHILPMDHFVVSAFFKNRMSVQQWCGERLEEFEIHEIEIEV